MIDLMIIFKDMDKMILTKNPKYVNGYGLILSGSFINFSFTFANDEFLPSKPFLLENRL